MLIGAILLTSALAASLDMSSASDADYVRQHGLLLVNTGPGPGNPSASDAIYSTHADGSAKTVVANEGGAPSWTPDGRIIFSARRSGSQQIWIMDSSGRKGRQTGNLSPNMLPVMAQMGKNGLIVFMGN